MSEYAPLRDAFHDMNKMLLDKQQWDQKFELEKENQGIHRMQVESQLQDASLKRADLERKAMIDKDAMQMVPVNIYDNVPRSAYSDRRIFDESDAAQKYAEAMIPEYKGGITVDRASGLVRDANGEVFRLPKVMAATRATGAYGIIAQQFDPVAMINENVMKTDAKINEVEATLRKIPMTDVASRKIILEQLSEARKIKTEHMNMLNDPDRLIPLYQHKVTILDGMAMKAAASNVDPMLVQQLQYGSQRAVSDLQHLRLEASKKREEALNRQAKREEKEMTLEDRKEARANALLIAEAKSSASKGQQHYVQNVDKEGNPIPGTTKVYNAPKDAGTLAPPPPGTVYVEELKLTAAEKKAAAASEGKIPDAVVKDINKNNWLSLIQDEIGGTKSVTLQADIPRVTATEIVIGRDYDLINPKTGKKYDPFTIATRAQGEIIMAEKAFWEDFDRLNAQNATKLGVKDLNKEEKDFLIDRMANEKGGFFEDYKYVPRLEHRKSLDRAVPGVVGRAEETK